MKKISSFLLFFALSAAAFSQIKVEKIFEMPYDRLPFKIRIENSGIYGTARFDVDNGIISMSTYDAQDVYRFSSSRFLDKAPLKSYKKNLAAEQSTADANGFSTKVEGRDRLVVSSSASGFNRITIDFNHDLAYGDIIGRDKDENLYLIIERFLSDLPLKVKREVFCLNREGKILSVLEIPSIKYLSTISDFQVNEDGALYHFISDPEKISIYKWNGLNNYSSAKITYPEKFDENFDLTKYLPANEPVAQTQTASAMSPQATISRNSALRIADTYVLHRYTCSQKNLAPSDVTDAGGDKVRTPTWVIMGINAKIPYKWGGFNTLAQFDDGVKSGLYAGDINTAGISNYAVGVDCSGFVSRCWQLTYHSTTSGMPSITTQYSSWDDIKPGDAVLKSGHVRMFVEKCPNGSLRVVESSGRDWGVSYWTYTPSELSSGGYTPRCYQNMENNFSLKRPDITGAVVTDNSGTVQLTWKCDTAGVIGYRVYSSADGVNFTQILNENSVKTTSAAVQMTGQAQYFRVSSVINAAQPTESFWSAVMGTSKASPAKKVLIVDGYERENVWRGMGNPFLFNYGKVLEKNAVSFETVKTSYMQSIDLPLSNYSAVFWLLGDESTQDETFNAKEQAMVKKYLENGGALFVSGAEIGWDLGYKGTADDKAFYNNYLKANYVSDDADSKTVNGAANTLFSGISFNIGQTMPVDYPDEISPYGGSALCIQYDNNKGAGIAYAGKFGTSTIDGKVINLGFPLETTADDTVFSTVITKALAYFANPVNGIEDAGVNPFEFRLMQNYPNPFNPSTTIKFTVPKETKVSLKIFDILGREAATLVNEIKQAGTYSVLFNSHLSSGAYFYRIQAGAFTETKQMIILK